MDVANEYDVVVAGGGPAGATVAALLAREGHAVLLAEREPEPIFKIGESLIPATYWTFRRLGVLDRLRASRFVSKQSVQFYTRDGRATRPFYFFENEDHESSYTWQVLRSEFDQILLERAAEDGADVRRGLAVREALFDGQRAVGVRAEPVGGGPPREIGARVVVDATGQSALLARRLGLKIIEPHLRNASFFTHFQGGVRDLGIDEGATLVLYTPGGSAWFWYIPLPDDRVSVGLVGPIGHLVRGDGHRPEAVFHRELERCTALAARLASARQLFPVRATRDFSYRSRFPAGDGWVLVGDARGFIDPIYSTGVLLALQSGEWAADAIHGGLTRGDLSGRQLGRQAERFDQGVEALKSLVYAFYDERFSFASFLRRHPDCRGPLVDMLVGNVFRKPVAPFLEVLTAFRDQLEGPACEVAAG